MHHVHERGLRHQPKLGLGTAKAQLGLMPEAAFMDMVHSWAPARLAEFK